MRKEIDNNGAAQHILKVLFDCITDIVATRLGVIISSQAASGSLSCVYMQWNTVFIPHYLGVVRFDSSSKVYLWMSKVWIQSDQVSNLVFSHCKWT